MSKAKSRTVRMDGAVTYELEASSLTYADFFTCSNKKFAGNILLSTEQHVEGDELAIMVFPPEGDPFIVSKEDTYIFENVCFLDGKVTLNSFLNREKDNFGICTAGEAKKNRVYLYDTVDELADHSVEFIMFLKEEDGFRWFVSIPYGDCFAIEDAVNLIPVTILLEVDSREERNRR